MNLYTCEICHAPNLAFRITCRGCGTIKSDYSIIGKPAIMNSQDQFIEVVPAFGCERLESRRASKTYFRTVPLDYYADASRQE